MKDQEEKKLKKEGRGDRKGKKTRRNGKEKEREGKKRKKKNGKKCNGHFVKILPFVPVFLFLTAPTTPVKY